MPLTALLLVCLVVAIYPQIAPNTPQTLSSLYWKSSDANQVELKAMEYLLITYPQLGPYFNVTMRLIRRGKNPFGLQDVYFTLQSNQTRVSVITTLSQLSPGEFISISPLVITVTGNSSTAANSWRARDSNLYILSGDQIKVINSANHTQSALPGGFQGYSRFGNPNDTRLDRGEALLASLHPHMLNYYPQQVSYQVVSGINFNVQYSGYDGMTAVTALVMVNLEMEPFLLGFHVHCQNQNETNMEVACTEDLAYQIFSACESFLLVHPELLAYELISMVSDDSTPENGLVFVLTYQNKEEGMRVMAELNIFGNVFSVLSFYTYVFP